MPPALTRPQPRVQAHAVRDDLVAAMGDDRAEELSCLTIGWEAGVFGETQNCQSYCLGGTYNALAIALFSI